MASQTLLVLMLLFVLAASASSASADDSETQYIQWELNNKVNAMSVPAGSSVQFIYPEYNHNVVMVSQADYYNCGTSVQMAFYNAGNTVVQFPVTGTFWFICSIEDHCLNYGMKLEVTVY